MFTLLTNTRGGDGMIAVFAAILAGAIVDSERSNANQALQAKGAYEPDPFRCEMQIHQA
jgi:hypothetical protein